MIAVFADPVVRLIVAPLIAVLVLGGLIRWVGTGERGEQISGAAVPVVFAWVAAFELGAPLYPPSADDNSIMYLLAAGVLIGLPFELLLAQETPQARHAEAGVALLYGLAAVGWIRGVIDISTASVVIAWGIVVIRMHLVAAADAATASSLLAVAAGGLGAAAWASGLEGERDLAIALASAASGYFVLHWLNPAMRFGAILVLGGLGALLILTVRLLAATQAIAPALLILGFIFFADAPARRLLGRRIVRLRWAMPIFAALASLLPIGLAALAAYIGVNYEAS
jgi:hypothetical protein